MNRLELRRRAEDLIEQLIGMLDDLDGDPDFEIDPACEIETDRDINPISLQGVDRAPVKRVATRRAA